MKMSTKKRPISVTIIAWFVIISSILGFVIGLGVVKGLIRITIAALAGFLGMIIGAGMFKGFNWARLLYLWLQAIFLIFSLLIKYSGLYGEFGPWDILKVVIYIVCFVFLTRPAASLFFTGTKRDIPGELGSWIKSHRQFLLKWQTISAIILIIISGFLLLNAFGYLIYVLGTKDWDTIGILLSVFCIIFLPIGVSLIIKRWKKYLDKKKDQ